MRRLIVLLALAALAAPTSAAASAPESVSGTFAAPPPVPASVHEAGSNCFAEIPGDTFALQGALEGSLVLDFRLHFHSPCSAIAFPAEFHATGTFTGTVTAAGRERAGGFDVVFAGTIDEQPLAQGTLVIRRGTGGLAGIHGVLGLEGIPGVGGTYGGRLHFSP